MSSLKFLAFSDLEGRHDLMSLLTTADLSKYDFLLYKGDTPDPHVYKELRKARTLAGNSWEKKTSSAFLEESEEAKKAFIKAVEDSTKINDIFSILKKKLPLYGVLGNSDTVPTMIAPKVGLPPVDFSKNINIIHKRVVEFKGFYFVGYNGRAQYLDETIIEAPDLYFNEQKAAQDLHELFKNVDPVKTLFITHAPPYGILDKVQESWVAYGVGTYGEKAKDGHIGSDAFKEIVFKYQPLLHTFGHIHETPGIEKHGKTTFINGGALGETGEIEEVTIQGDKVTCRWVKLTDL